MGNQIYFIFDVHDELVVADPSTDLQWLTVNAVTRAKH
jgi:hypothetical protein